jgi:ubiquinone/menaquinone biosynthesis C-methylase UbiE
MKNKLFFNQINRDKFIFEFSKKISNGMTVLDVGAGSAPYRDLFTHCHYITQDAMPLKPEQLRDGGYSQLDIISDINKINLDNSSVDVIICTEVLEHVPYPINAIKEMIRILKPNGTLLLTAPLGSGLHQQPYHFYGGYTPFWYKLFLKDFSEIEIIPNGNYYNSIGQEILRLATWIKPSFRNWRSILFLPLFILLIICGSSINLFSDILYRFNANDDYVVGYHVIAKRKMDN